jgi:hypothetical protein
MGKRIARLAQDLGTPDAPFRLDQGPDEFRLCKVHRELSVGLPSAAVKACGQMGWARADRTPDTLRDGSGRAE